MKLTNSDFITILKHYNQTIPLTKKEIKRKAINIMQYKLCSCVNATKRIGICTQSIFNNNGLQRGTFLCEKNKKRTKRTKNKNKLNVTKKKKTIYV